MRLMDIQVYGQLQYDTVSINKTQEHQCTTGFVTGNGNNLPPLFFLLMSSLWSQQRKWCLAPLAISLSSPSLWEQGLTSVLCRTKPHVWNKDSASESLNCRELSRSEPREPGEKKTPKGDQALQTWCKAGQGQAPVGQSMFFQRVLGDYPRATGLNIHVQKHTWELLLGWYLRLHAASLAKGVWGSVVHAFNTRARRSGWKQSAHSVLKSTVLHSCVFIFHLNFFQ